MSAGTAGGLARRIVLLLGGLFALGFLLAGPASAHASVVSSSPADGARLKSAPASVTITFDESVGIGSGVGYLNVIDQHGARVDTAAASHPHGNGTEVSVPLKSGLGDGTYTASYRVISADSHPVSGVVRFVVGNGPLVASSATGAPATSDGGVASAFDITRWLSYAGIALLGGGWLVLTVWPAGRDDRRARGLIWSGLGLATVGAILELLLEGAFAAGTGLTSVFRWTLVNATLHSDYGQLHCARLVMLGVLALVMGLAVQPGRERALTDDAFWPLAVGVAYTFSASGHADTTNPTWLSIGADMLHVCAMGVWLGGLIMLCAAVLPRRDPDELSRVLPTFSRAAFASVVVLAATGTYAAWRGIGSWRALFHTEYGLLVIGKVVLFCGLLALGNLSRVVIQRRLARPVVAYAMTADVAADEGVRDGSGSDDSGSDDGGSDEGGLDDVTAERMRRSVWVEVVLGAVVLALTAVLVSQPRGSEALAAQERDPVTASASLGSGRTATITITPGVHGDVEVGVKLTGGSAPKAITATAADPAKQLGPLPLKLSRVAGGSYQASGANLPVAGTWTVALAVTYSKFDAVTTDAKLTLH